MPSSEASILVVEDDREFASVLRDMLGSLGYRCHLARDGYEALKHVLSERPSLVLADVLLPKLNGFEVCQKIKAKSELRSTPVILMSSVYRNREQMSRDMVTYQADAYIAKPFGLTVLRTQLEGHLEQSAATPPRSAPATPSVPPNPRPPSRASTFDEAPLPPRPPPPPRSQASRTKTGESLMTGRFPEPTFAELIHEIYHRGASGVLEVRWEGAWKRLYVLNGVIVAADSNASNETIGALLLGEGRIEPSDLDRAVVVMKEQSCRFGEALVRAGAITESERYDALRRQLRERALKCFTFERGLYSFVVDGGVAQDRITFELHPARLVFEGIRQYMEVNEVAVLLGDHLESYPVPTDRYAAYLPYLRGCGTEWDSVLGRLDGRVGLGELVGHGGIDMPDLLKGLWALRVLKMVEFRDQPATHTSPILPSRPADGDDGRAASEPPEVRATAERILRDYLHLQGADPWTILGVARDADIRAAEDAATSKRAAYHPDSLPDQVSGEVRERAKELYYLVGRALESIQDGDGAFRTVDACAPGRGQAELNREASEAEAGRLAARGRQLIESGDFGAALDIFRQGLDLVGDSASFLADAGWCLLHLTSPDVGKRLADAEEELRRSVALEPNLARGHFYLGVLLKETGRGEEAKDHFRACVRCDPDHREARWQLQLLEFRLRRETAASPDEDLSFWDRILIREPTDS